jgi:hypothetical protein
MKMKGEETEQNKYIYGIYIIGVFGKKPKRYLKG